MTFAGIVTPLKEFIVQNTSGDVYIPGFEIHGVCDSCSSPDIKHKYCAWDSYSMMPHSIAVCGKPDCKISVAGRYKSLSIFLPSGLNTSLDINIRRTSGELQPGWSCRHWRLSESNRLLIFMVNDSLGLAREGMTIEKVIEDNQGNPDMDVVLREIDSQIREQLEEINMKVASELSLDKA
jgi:hypothetical protein